MSEKKPAESRAAFAHFHQITTRWMDNDAYGHVNNVIYYSYFDTAVNEYLIGQGALDITKSEVIGLVVETQCRYFSSIAFPDTIHVGVRVAHLGNSSVRYELGIFRNDDDVAAAQGHFVHVYVDRVTNRPTALPQALRNALEPLCMQGTIA
ncbi:thioesterase family protein [Janthinobacterium sp. 17J80-10]|uniref:acyl-CoA thioesterase n=1 Tax=Janthinobacterium sp. 17J80-10 TaxID=2497863 RepID=UPI001F50EADE|nr:thioesterase family protein [Janthinobacterium sp. 17J80-10]